MRCEAGKCCRLRQPQQRQGPTLTPQIDCAWSPRRGQHVREAEHPRSGAGHCEGSGISVDGQDDPKAAHRQGESAKK